MSTYSLTHLSDGTLLSNLAALLARDRVTTAELLAHIAEVDARRLHLPAAHPSMYSYCVHELHLSEEAAFKRIHAARAARQFPAIFPALADGRLHLSAVVMLAPHLTPENAGELLTAAAFQSKAGIERLLAARFPRPDLPAGIEALVPPPPDGHLVPFPLEARGPGDESAGPANAGQHAPGRAEAPDALPRLAPLSAERYSLQVTIGQSAHEKLQYARVLLGHAVPSGDVAQVIERALDALIGELERRKFAATKDPGATNRVRLAPRRASASPRHIPAEVKRVVWERDGGRCTFSSEAGRRCPALTRLEFDHVDPVARGGRATVENTRLRCRAHNQYEAERTYGAGFMSHKREAARRAAAEARARRAEERSRRAAEERGRKTAETHAQESSAAERAREKDVTPWLRKLGYSAREARQAAELCESIPEASLEDRVRLALSYFVKPCQRRLRPRAAGGDGQ